MRDVDPLDLVETIREGARARSDHPLCEPLLLPHVRSRARAYSRRKLYEIGNGEWDIPELHTLLETVISGRKTIEAFEVELYFPSIGQRKMLLNARKVYQPDKKIQQILLAIEDITERVRLERQHAADERIGVLLQELTHRVENSLQFIASMITIEARYLDSAEGKAALARVSRRILALGHLYSKLSESWHL
jgi:hypothetical protein